MPRKARFSFDGSLVRSDSRLGEVMVKHHTDYKISAGDLRFSEEATYVTSPLPNLPEDTVDRVRAQLGIDVGSASLASAPASRQSLSSGSTGPHVINGANGVAVGALTSALSLVQGTGGDLVGHANASGDARQSDALLGKVRGELLGVALKASQKQNGEIALGEANQDLRPSWLGYALDAAEYLAALGGSGASVASANLSDEWQAAAGLGYLGHESKQASGYLTQGAVGTARAFETALKHRYGYQQTIASFYRGYVQAFTAGFSEKFPGLSAALSIVGGYEALRRIASEVGGTPQLSADNQID